MSCVRRGLRAPILRIALGGLALLLAVPLAAEPPGERSGSAETTDPARGGTSCRDRDPHRNLYFGDLHVHTARSHETWIRGVRRHEAGAYRFARGERVPIPPYDDAGEPDRWLQLDRPLDFAAVTDHAESLAEVAACTTPGSGAYDGLLCRIYRRKWFLSEALIAFPTGMPWPRRTGLICGEGRADCPALTRAIWSEIARAADAATDDSPACRFAAFPAYEYTAMPYGSNLHRNVIFRDGRVPAAPVSYMEEPELPGLWRALTEECREGVSGCDVLAIPHNPNQSNGRKFPPGGRWGHDAAPGPERARLRAAAEPLAEIFQHKGDSECSLRGGEGAASDPLCRFEKSRPDADTCGPGETGVAGAVRWGCVSRRDFLRAALLEGLEAERRIGVNPYKLGFVAGTDSHNATPGAASEAGYVGHWGIKDDEPGERLGGGSGRHRAIRNTPGGLTAAWAVENSRAALFEAFRRREVYATSGPRIEVRLFGSFGYAGDLCETPDATARAYRRGVPMGGDLGGDLASRSTGGSGGPPRLFVRARRDGLADGRPGTPLERIQIVKGWVDADGRASTRVFDVAGRPVDPAEAVDPATCAPKDGAGARTLCTVWEDPGFDPAHHAYYYARVLEVPTCRWSHRQCLALPEAERPEGCSAPEIPRTIQERAWTSPIWYRPPHQAVAETAEERSDEAAW